MNNQNSKNISIFKSKTFKSSYITNKYEIIKQLGNGSNSFVFLAKHKTLDSMRAIKVISKDISNYDTIVSEALLLKSLNHKGIPLIYDVEEDNDNFYLIQEYVSGTTLGEYLSYNKHISLKLFISLCKNLSEIYSFLHNSFNTPIFYQDLKPEHIFLQDDYFKLIDFGSSNYSINDVDINASSYKENSASESFSSKTSSMNVNSMINGNLYFSAPEVIRGEQITIKSDIYTLAKLINYVMEYVDERLSNDFLTALYKALSSDPNCRFETVDSFMRELLKNPHESESCSISQPYKKIAVFGTSHGCGSTHFSIALSTFLNSQHFPSVYMEKNDSNHLIGFQKQNPLVTEVDGYLKYKNFNGLPNYGEGILINKLDSKIQIHDYGVLNNFNFSNGINSDKYDLIFLIIPSSQWLFDSCFSSIEKYLNYFPDKNIAIIANLSNFSSNSKHLIAISKHFNLPVYKFSYDKNPFIYSKEKEKFFSQVLNLERRKRRFLGFINKSKGLLQ